MLEITNAIASANILRFVEEGRLIQSKWHDRAADGRELACLLGAIDPNVTSTDQCNGTLMPMWLAKLTPLLFDGMPKTEAIGPFARRYAASMANWDVLNALAWDRMLTKTLIKCIDVAFDAAKPVAKEEPYWSAVEAACAQSKAAIESGNETAARAAAWAAEAAARAAEAAEAAAYKALADFILDMIDAEIVAVTASN